MIETEPIAMPPVGGPNYFTRRRVTAGLLIIASVMPNGGAHGTAESSAVELRPQPLSEQDPFGLDLYDSGLTDIAVPVDAATSTTTSTSRPPETTTTTLPELEVQPGQFIATLDVPRLCDINIDVVALSDEEIINGRLGLGPDYENGGSYIDELIDDIPQPDCEETLEHAINMRGGLEQPLQGKEYRGKPPYYATRGERVVRGTSRRANTYRPLVGYMPGTAKPGEPGVFVVVGHRTTRSKPFASIDMMEPGDGVSVSLPSVGTTLRYRVTSVRVMSPDVDAILDQTPSEGAESGMRWFACTPQGSASERLVVDFVLEK